MRKNTAISNLFWTAAALIFGAAIAASAAQPQKQAPAVNTSCLACHQASSLQGSVHSSLSCADCHRIPAAGATKEVPHAPKKDIPLVDCTAKCHGNDTRTQQPGQSPSSYADSVHGKGYLERGEMDVAKCWDCHGKHNIKPVQAPDSVVNRRNIPLVCSHCHENMNVVLKYNIHAESPYQEYMQSVHGKALFEKGLVTFAAVCTDCHGVHNIQGAGQIHMQAKDPATCGKCHVLVFDEYKDSIHGREALKGNIDVPLCVDCHGEHKVAPVRDAQAPTSKKNIPDTCSGCHARPEIMKKYGVPADRIQTFIESFHGIAIGLGDKAEASCTDCHGVHNIKPAIDPISSVHSSNLAKTCGQPKCHPGMPEQIATAKIHREAGAKRSGTPYYINKILLWTLLIVLAITVIWFVFELVHKLGRPKTP